MIDFRSTSRYLPTFTAAIVALATAFAPGPAQARQVLLVASTRSSGSHPVGKYDAVTGATINSPFFSLPFTGGHPMVVDPNNHLFVVGSAGLGGGVAEFDAISGATINAQFVSVPGLNPQAIALDGKNHLFVADIATNTVGEYDATTGATINRNFVQGLSGPGGIAVDNKNHLFVSNGSFGGDTQTIGQYDATTGATINASLISGLYEPSDLHVDSLGRLLVAHGHVDSSLIGAFNATTGAPINPGFIYVGAGFPNAFALDGNNHLFEANFYGSVGEYDATTGAPINANLVTGVPSYPTGIVYVPAPVPEPSSLLLLAGAAATAVGMWRRKWLAGRRRVALLVALAAAFAARPAQARQVLLVANHGNGTVGEYNAATGAPVNAAFISLPMSSQPLGLALDGNNHVFVANVDSNSSFGVGSVQCHNRRDRQRQLHHRPSIQPRWAGARRQQPPLHGRRQSNGGRV